MQVPGGDQPHISRTEATQQESPAAHVDRPVGLVLDVDVTEEHRLVEEQRHEPFGAAHVRQPRVVGSVAESVHVGPDQAPRAEIDAEGVGAPCREERIVAGLAVQRSWLNPPVSWLPGITANGCGMPVDSTRNANACSSSSSGSSARHRPCGRRSPALSPAIARRTASTFGTAYARRCERCVSEERDPDARHAGPSHSSRMSRSGSSTSPLSVSICSVDRLVVSYADQPGSPRGRKRDQRVGEHVGDTGALRLVAGETWRRRADRGCGTQKGCPGHGTSRVRRHRRGWPR